MGSLAAPAAAAPPASTDVFVEHTGGYFAYRIPAIETAPDGSLLAFAEARKYNLDDPGYRQSGHRPGLPAEQRRRQDMVADEGHRRPRRALVGREPGHRGRSHEWTGLAALYPVQAGPQYRHLTPRHRRFPGAGPDQRRQRIDLVGADRPDPRLARLRRSEMASQRRRARGDDPGPPRSARGRVLEIRAVRQLRPVQ